MSTKISFFKVSNREITKINDVRYAGTSEVDKFHFFFEDAEWEELNKTLEVLIDGEIQGFPIVNDEAEVGRSVYKPGIVYIRIHGIKGSKDLKTLNFPIPISAADCDDGDPANTPTESEWNAFITEINAKLAQAVITKEECEAILAQVLAYRDIVSDDKDDVEQLKTDVQSLKTDVQGLKSTIEQEIEEAEGVLDTYNANYVQKLADFNDNFTAKKKIIDNDVSDFEDDYEEKMSALNTAGTEKVNAVNTAGSTQVGNVNTAGNTQVGNVNSAGATQKTAVETAGATQLNAVNGAGATQKAAVESAGETQVGNVNTAGSTQVSAVNSAGTQQTSAVNSAGSTQVAAVESAGTTQVGNVNAAGTTQTNAVNQAGQQKLDAINSNQTVQQVANHESRLRVLEKKDGRAYSVIRKITDNSATAWTRADDAVGLIVNARKETSGEVQNDLKNMYPWCDMKLCNIDNNGTPTYYYGEAGFTFLAEVYVYVPKCWLYRGFYQKEEDGVTNTYEKRTTYDYNAPGSIEVNPFLVGAKPTSVDGNGNHVSISGGVPLYNTTKATFRTKARARGEKFSLLDIFHWNVLQHLYLCEFADNHSQNKLGQGIVAYSTAKAIIAETSVNRIICNSAPTGLYVGKTICIGTSAAFNSGVAKDRQITAIEDYSDANVSDKKAIYFDGSAVDIAIDNVIWGSAQKSGQLDSFGNDSGCLVDDGYHSMVWHGIEDIIGNVWQHLDGVNVRDYVAYVCDDYTQYANDKFTSPYVALGYTNANTNDSYVKSLGYDENYPLIGLPTEVGGSSSTYYSDNYWCGAGDKIVYVGGSFINNWGKAGFFASNCNNASSNNNWNNGARHLIKKFLLHIIFLATWQKLSRNWASLVNN